MAWRGFQTAFLGLVTAIVTYIATHLGDSTRLQESVDRIEHRLTAVESKVDGLDSRVNTLTKGFIDGLMVPKHL